MVPKGPRNTNYPPFNIYLLSVFPKKIVKTLKQIFKNLTRKCIRMTLFDFLLLLLLWGPVKGEKLGRGAGNCPGRWEQAPHRFSPVDPVLPFKIQLTDMQPSQPFGLHLCSSSAILSCFMTVSPPGTESLSPAPLCLRHTGTSGLWPGAGHAITVSLRRDLVLF